MAAPATRATIGTILSTPVVFLPVPTPWPLSAGCDEYIWRRYNEGQFVAFDPGYARVDGGRGASCFQAQQTSVLYQYTQTSQTDTTALGPTFVCPESFTSIHSTLVDSDPESLTQYTYCCPPSYKAATIHPHTHIGLFEQCSSIVPVGSTLYFVSEYTLFDNLETIPSLQHSRTVVSLEAATVYGIAVNGYNIVPRRPLNTQTSETVSHTTSAQTTSTGSVSATTISDGPATGNNKLSVGAIAGAAVAGVAALIFLGLVLWYMRKRAIRSKAAAAGGGLSVVRETPVAREIPVAMEIPVKYFHQQETPDQNPRHELASQNPTWVHEMPGEYPTQTYGFPVYQDAPGHGAGYQPGGLR